MREVTVDGIVDTDTMSLVVPEELATSLGLRQFGRRTVVYANEQREERLVAGPVTVQIGRLALHTDCIVGAPGSEVVIGRIVLEALDLGVDHTNQTLAPRHPEGPVLALR